MSRPPHQNPLRQFVSALVNTEWNAANVCRLLFNHNPFYLVSAGLVLFGLGAGFGTDDIWINTTIPLVIMLAYAALLAGTAVAIVRFGRVWEDARSILLTLAVLFFTISAALDELLVRDGSDGELMVWGVWIAVPVLAELVRRGIGVRWPICMTAAFHLGMMLVLIYPALPAKLLLTKQPELVIWSIAAFPLVAGLALLAFLPAVRRLAMGTLANGTPWKNLHWAAISAVTLALVTRAYLLATAFYPYPGEAAGGYHRLDTAFGGWFCAPIVLAGAWLVLEAGIVRNAIWLQRFALITAPLIIPLAMVGPSGSAPYLAVRDEVTASLASPPFLAATGVLIFAATAWLRRVRGAGVCLFGSILLLTPLGVDTVSFETLKAPSLVPLLMAAAACFAYLRRYRHSMWFLGGWAALSAALGSILPESLSQAMTVVAIGHFVLLGVLATVFLFRDQLARWLLSALSVALPVILGCGLWWLPASWTEPGALLRLCYLAGGIVVTVIMFKHLQYYWLRFTIGAELTLGAVFIIRRFGMFLDQINVRGSGRIIAGLCVLGLAIFISLYKARHAEEEEEEHA